MKKLILRSFLILCLCTFGAMACVVFSGRGRGIVSAGGQAAPTNTMYVWYKFADSNACSLGYYVDSSLYGNHGTQSVASSMATWSEPFKTLSFDGTDYLWYPSLTSAAASFAVSGSISLWWFDNITASVNYGLFNYGRESGDTYKCMHIYRYANTINFRTVGPGNDFYMGVTPDGGCTNRWMNIVLTYQLNDAKLYVNGLLIGWLTSGTLVGLDDPYARFIGARADASGNPYYQYQGLIDDVRLYPQTILSSNDAVQLYVGGRQ